MNKDEDFISSAGNSPGYSDWLVDLIENEQITAAELRAALAEKFSSAEEIERAAKEVEISRRIRKIMISLQSAKIEVPADFEAKLMARVGEDETLLRLLEMYLTGFGQALFELLKVLSGLLPESKLSKAPAGS